MSADVRELYREDFRRIESTVPGRNIPWLRALRHQALEQFMQSGFPTPKIEEWKYTDVRPIGLQHFAPAERAGVVPELVQPYCFDALTLVFIDGFFALPLSTRHGLPTGVHVMNLVQALSEDAAEIEPWLGRFGPLARHGFGSLNLALMQDGAFVHIEPGVSVVTPIHLLFVSTGKPDAGAYLRNVVVAEQGSEATVVESYVTLGNANCLTNAVTEVMLERGAALEHYRLEREGEATYHIGSTRVHLERDSRYVSHSVTLGGRIVRHELTCTLDAEGAQCLLNGLYVGRGQQHMDHHTRIDHYVARGTSREWYRGILADAARGVFSGRVVVHPQAQHTDAEQSNHNLVLSANAEADSRPQFEIYADDVKCSHGSSTGNLDADALFYLRSRGLDEPRARQLLVYAFAADVLERMKFAPARAAVEQELAGRLLGGQRVDTTGELAK